MTVLKDRNLILLLCVFLPFTYIAGILITEISVIILTIYFLFKNKSLKFFKSKEIIGFVIFSIYIAIIAILKIEHNDLKISSIFYIRFILFSLSIYFILEYSKSRMLDTKYALIVIYGFLLLIFFDSFYQFFVGKNFFGYSIINSRVSSIFGSELILGSFLIKILPIIIWLSFYFKFEIKKNAFFLIFFFSLYLITIYLSGGRTSFALMIISVILMIFFVNPLKKILSFSLAILILFISLTGIFNFGKSEIFNRVVMKTFNQVTNNLFVKEDENKVGYYTLEKFKNSEQSINKNIKLFSSDHHGHYELALNLLSQKPLTGIGPKGFRFHCRKINYDSKIGICSTHPHNTAIQIISETGIIGFSFYLTFFLFIIFNFFKFRKKNLGFYEKNGFLVISIGLLIYLFPLLPSGNFFNNWLSIILFYCIGFYFYSYNTLRKL